MQRAEEGDPERSHGFTTAVVQNHVALHPSASQVHGAMLSDPGEVRSNIQAE